MCSSEITASWSATISLASTPSGVKVALRPAQVIPKVTIADPRNTSGYETQKEALEQLKKVFPSSINLAALVNELKDALEGVWGGLQVEAYEYCFSRPVFNRRGDLLLELVVQGSTTDNASRNRESSLTDDSGIAILA